MKFVTPNQRHHFQHRLALGQVFADANAVAQANQSMIDDIKRYKSLGRRLKKRHRNWLRQARKHGYLDKVI